MPERVEFLPLIERGGARKVVPLVLCLGMAAVPAYALAHAGPPPSTPSGARNAKRVTLVADASPARDARDRVSRSDEPAPALPEETTTTAPPPTTAPSRPTLYKA